MADNVLKEFLVRLGFKIDDAGMARFSRGVVSLTKDVAALSAGITAMAAAVGYAVSRTAQHFDELYYASQRTGATAENLMKLRFVATQVGVGVEAMNGQIEGLARTLRDAPYMRGYLDTITQGMTAGLKDPTAMIEKIAEFYERMLKRGGYAEMIARMQLKNFGIDPDTIRQMAQNLDVARANAADYVRWLQQLRINAQDAAKMGVDTQRGLNRLWTQFSLIWQKTAIELMPVLSYGLERVNRYIGEHQEELAGWIEGTLKPWVTWLTDPATWTNFEENLDKIVAQTKEWGTAAITVSTTIRDLVKFITEHPTLMKVLGGAYIGARVAGGPGAVVGAGAGLAADAAGGEAAAAGGYKKIKEGERITWSDEPFVQVWQRMMGWLSGKTHSPNVDIYEARGLWNRMKDWLSGSTSVVPTVKLQGHDATESDGLRQKLVAFFGLGGGSGGRTRDFNPQAPGYRPAGRFGAAAPGRAGGREAMPLPGSTFDAISQAEGTWKGGKPNYNDMLGHVGGPLGTPPKPISEMTLDEVQAWQGKMLSNRNNRWNSSAAGAFQIVRTTLRDHMKRLKMTGADKFDKATQERLASSIWGTQGPGAWEGFKAHPDLRRRAEAMAGKRRTVGGAPSEKSQATWQAPAEHEAFWKYNREHPARKLDWDAYRRMISAPGSPGAAAAGDRNVNMSQKTDIHVYGGDAGLVRGVVNAQGRVNSDLVRNLTPAIV